MKQATYSIKAIFTQNNPYYIYLNIFRFQQLHSSC